MDACHKVFEADGQQPGQECYLNCSGSCYSACTDTTVHAFDPQPDEELARLARGEPAHEDEDPLALALRRQAEMPDHLPADVLQALAEIGGAATAADEDQMVDEDTKTQVPSMSDDVMQALASMGQAETVKHASDVSVEAELKRALEQAQLL